MPRPHDVPASEVVRNLLRPLCGAAEAGCSSDVSTFRIHMAQVIQVLDTLGFNREAKRLDESLQ